MYQIQQDELLTKVTEYNLFRKKRIWVKILVHELIAGEWGYMEKYQAVPTGPHGCAPVEQISFSDTEQGALTDCIEKLKNVDDETILEWFHKQLHSKGRYSHT